MSHRAAFALLNHQWLPHASLSKEGWYSPTNPGLKCP
jgi:hypothetical protein